MPVTFRNILIANRGEIALRILRAIRKAGISVTGVYSEQDKFSPWIDQCDRAWSLGEGTLSDTYLNIDKIIDVAKQSGVDAIHPGYGFLSENYRFAEACRENNIYFIGPTPEILRIAGDKQQAYDLARSADIRVPEMILAEAGMVTSLHKVIYPVMAKSATGAGGKGIRQVKSDQELETVLKLVADESINCFGNSRVYLEQFINNARHIEVQILGDSYGNIVHLYERECSVQRRHQKLIEESPSAILTDQLRNDIIDAAVKIARKLNFVSAGTIEFLLDENENFYFLEINPRIQVEHGITEMLTGIDIVGEQIRIAEGLELSFKQDDVIRRGHSVEVRVYSEDPENHMMPSPGKIHYISLPQGEGIRVDTGVSPGYEVQPDFDPLITKIMVHHTSRDNAIALMKEALRGTVISGLPTNLPLYDLIFDDEDFNNNRLSTTWLDKRFSEFSYRLRNKKISADPVLLSIAAALTVIFGIARIAESPWNSGFWRNVRQIRFISGDRLVELEYAGKGKNSIAFFAGDDLFSITNVYVSDYDVKFDMNGVDYNFYVVPEKDGIIWISDGHTRYAVERYFLRNRDFLREEVGSEGNGDTVVAPQPGKVIEIKVKEGQHVNKGDYLLVIESMKLENTLLATSNGIIKKINIKAGDRVSKNEPLMYLQQNTINSEI